MLSNGDLLSHRIAVLRRCGLLLQSEKSDPSVGLSVGRSVTIVSPVKTAEPIEMPFGGVDSGGLKEPLLDGDKIPHAKRRF